MKVLNLIWGFTLGAGIDKCYLTYAHLGDVDKDIEMLNVCINLKNLNSHIEPLREIGVKFIDINGKLDFSWINKLKKLIDEEKPNILFTHGFNGAIISFIETKLKGAKLKTVLTYHGAYHAPTKLKKLIEPFYNGMSEFIYRHFAYKTICVAQSSTDYLTSRHVPKDRLVTVHNGIKDLKPEGNLQLEGDGMKILTASRVDVVKGLPYMLDALAILKKKGVPFTYYMVGEGPLLNELKQKTIELGLENNIVFAGYQSNVIEWLNATDIFALPSLFEYHSIAVLEAMRAGKAIVATNVGGNCESVRDMEEGIVVPPEDSVAFAAALEKMILDKQLRNRLSANARKRFEQEFTEEAMMRNLVAVLKS